MSKYVTYLSVEHADELNEAFQETLSKTSEFSRIASEVFLFNSEICYQREREFKSKVIINRKGKLESSDLKKIEDDINMSKSITEINGGNLELDKSSAMSTKLTQHALDFLISNSKRVDYIAGLRKAKVLGFKLDTDFDILENGTPLKIRMAHRNRAKINDA